MNIPTAEEFYFETTQCHINHRDIKRAMVEFAKLHVEKALEAALEDAPWGSSTDTVSYKDMKDAILNSYPLDNIK